MAFLNDDVTYREKCHILSLSSPPHQFFSNEIFPLATAEANADQSLSHMAVLIWRDHPHKIIKSDWKNPDTKSVSNCIQVEGESIQWLFIFVFENWLRWSTSDKSVEMNTLNRCALPFLCTYFLPSLPSWFLVSPHFMMPPCSFSLILPYSMSSERLGRQSVGQE